MRFKTVLSFSTLSAIVATLVVGCGPGTEVKLADAPPVAPVKPGPLSKDTKKAPPSSSGHLGRNPGADPLAPH